MELRVLCGTTLCLFMAREESEPPKVRQETIVEALTYKGPERCVSYSVRVVLSLLYFLLVSPDILIRFSLLRFFSL